MEKKIFTTIVLLTVLNLFAQTSAVGINETTPQQVLHLGSSSGTIRVDGLNDVNSTFNGGGSVTYPLYVDGDGNLTLEFKPLYNSNGSDALDHATLPGSVVTLPSGDNDGLIVGELFNFTIAVNRASILEVKYNVSMDVFSDPAESVITDRLARRVNTYFQVNGLGRKYGQAGKCYTSGTADGETGKLFNTSTYYISLPAAGSYVIRFYGEVSSGITGNSANTGVATCVKFARGNDSLLFRLH
jgi:hypothetical protein